MMSQSDVYRNTNLSDLKNELWLPVVGFENAYSVSNLGRIKSVDRQVNKYFFKKGRVLPQRQKGNGKYLVVQLCYKGKRFFGSAHRHVAKAFVANEFNKPYVNHLNGSHKDNRAINLAWCTHSENIRHAFDVLGRKGGATGRTGAKHPMSKKVGQFSLAGELLMVHDSIACAYRHLGIKKGGTIYSAVANFNLSAYGYRWKYTESVYEKRKKSNKISSQGKLTINQVIEIFKSSGRPKEVAVFYPVGERMVRDIRSGRKWTSVTSGLNN